MKFRDYSIEDWLLIIIGTIIITFVAFFFAAISGCAKQQKVSNIDVLWSGEKCLFHSAGMTIEQAENIKKAWNFQDCEVTVNTDDDGKGPPHKQQPPKD